MPLTFKSLPILTAPVGAPITTEVASPPKLIVVAFSGSKLNVEQLVRIEQPFTVSVPLITTLPFESGVGTPSLPYKLVVLAELVGAPGVEEYKLEELILSPYLMLY